MCFVKDSVRRKKRVHRVSDKDITCYKLVYGASDGQNFTSPVMGFVYTIGETYTNTGIPLYELDEMPNLLGGVFHSYSKVDTADIFYLTLKGDAMCGLGCSILECVIPAGTPYWYSAKYNEYASTAIKIVKAQHPVQIICQHKK